MRKITFAPKITALTKNKSNTNNSFSFKKSISAIAVILALMCFSTNANAAVRDWIGKGSATNGVGTDLNAAANWSGSGALLTTDDFTITITTNAAATLTFTASITVNSITVNLATTNLSASRAYIINMSNNVVVTVNGGLTANNNSPNSLAIFSIVSGITGATTTGGWIIKGATNIGSSSAAGKLVYLKGTAGGTSTASGIWEFDGDVTFGANCSILQTDYPTSWIFDGTVTQSWVVNSANIVMDCITTGALKIGNVNTPIVNLTGTSSPSLNGTTAYGIVTIKEGATLDLGTNTLNKAGLNNPSYDIFTINGKLRLGSNTGGQTGSNFPSPKGTGGYSSFTTNVATGTVEYYATGAQTIYTGVTTAYNNLTLSGSGIKTITSVVTNGILSMQGTATTTFVTTAATFGAAATLEYKGSALQTTGTEFPATFAGTGGLIINNSARVTLGAAKSLSALSKLTLTAGILTTTSTFLLSVLNTATTAISGGSATCFISGPVKWSLPTLATTANYIFPVGKTNYYPFTLSPLTSTLPIVTVEAFNIAPTGGTTDSTLSALSTTEYWAVSNTGTYTQGTVSLTRQTAVTAGNLIARSSTLGGVYTSLGGTVSVSSINTSTATGNTLGFFCMATPPITSIATGNWSDTATWSGGVVPTSGVNAIIASGHTVTMDGSTYNTRNSGTTTTVNAGGILATGVTYTNNGTTTINGTFQINQNGYGGGSGTWTYGAASTLVYNNTSGLYGPITTHPYWPTGSTNQPYNVSFLGAGGVDYGTSTHTIAGTVTVAAYLNTNAGNLTISSTGTALVSATINNPSGLTINGTLKLNGGYGWSGSGSPTYGASSLLYYFSTGSPSRAAEWTTATSGAGYPANVQVGNNTTLGMLTNAAQCSGNITIDFNSTLNTTSGGLTVLGNVNTDGTIYLGGDVFVAGNWTLGASAAQTNNNKAVSFNAATGNQTITKTGAGTVYFDYLLINKATNGNVVFASTPATDVTINSTSGSVLQLLNNGGLDLNGRTLALNNSGGNIFVNGARTITSTVAAGKFDINQYKTISNNAGTGTLTFDTNVIVDLNTNGNLDFGKYGSNYISTVNGILSINSTTSCFVNTNAPIYGATSTLKYNCGAPYGRNLEWTTTSGAGYPNNVQISGNTTLDVGANSGNATARQMAGNLTTDSGSTFSLNSSAMSAAVTVNGNVINNGTLTLSSSSGGDISLKGNWTNNGTFNPNSRAVTFNGTTAQTLTGATTFDYLTMNNSTGLTLNNSITVNQTLTLTSGKITLGANNLTTAQGITSSATNYIVTNGTGFLKRNAIGNIDTLFPIGLNITDYTPITLTNTTGTSDLSVLVKTPITNAVADATKVVTLQWGVTSSAATTATVTPTWKAGNQGASFTNTGTGELGNWTSSYTTYPVTLATTTITPLTGVPLQSGSNLIVVGNTNEVVCTIPTNIVTAAASNLTASSAITWTAPLGCKDEIMIVAAPASNSGTPTGNGSAYNASLTYASGTALGNGFVVYKGSTSGQTVIGLTNGTTYYFKLFTRKGTVWSSGIEITATPVVTYCTPTDGSFSTSYYLNSITTTGGITNLSYSASSYAAYVNNSATTFSQIAGSSVSVTLGATPLDGHWYAWVDWNNNGVFTDLGEDPIKIESYTNSPYTGSITVPPGQALGNYRVRFSMDYIFTSTSCVGGAYGNYVDFTFSVVAPPVPTITSLGTSSGCSGTSITINGTGLTGAIAADVKIGGTAVTSITSNSGTVLVAVIGAGTTGTVAVTTAGGTATSAATFTVIAKPLTSNLSASAATSSCGGVSTVTVTSSTLLAGTYTVTYTVSGTNTITSTTASMTIASNGAGGTFTTAALTNSGSANVVNITAIAYTSTGCSSTVAVSTAAFTSSDNSTWTGTTSTDWNTATNWSCSLVPTASTNVTIATATNQPIIGGAAVCKNITLNSGTTLAINSTLGVSGNWTNNGTTISGSSTVTLNGATCALGGTTATTFPNLTITGTVTNGITGTSVTGTYSQTAGTFTANSPGTALYNLNFNIFSLTGGTFENQLSTSTTAGTITNINITGSFTQAATSTYTTSGLGVSSITFTGGGNTTYSNAYTNDVANFKWCSIQVSNNTTLTLSTALNIWGFATGNTLITVDAGSTLDAGIRLIKLGEAAVVGNIALNGTLKTANTAGLSGTTSTTIVSTDSPTLTVGSASTIEYNSAVAAQTVTSRTYSNLTINNTYTTNPKCTLGGVATVSGTLAVTSGILDASTFQITGNATNNFTLASGTTFRLAGTTTFPTLFTTANCAFHVASTVEYYGTTQTVSGTPVYGNLTITTTGTKTAGAALTVAGNLLINSGTFAASTFLHSVAGNWTNNGVFSFNNSGTTAQVTFTGASTATISGASATDFYKLAVNKGSDITSILDITGAVSVNSGGALTLPNGLLRVSSGATFTNSSITNTTIASTSGILVNGGTTTSTASYANNGLYRVVTGTAAIGAAAGNSITNATGSTLDVQGGTLAVSGRLVNTAGTYLQSGGTVTLCTVGNTSTSFASFDMSLTTNLNISGGTVVFQNPNTASPTLFNDINILNSTGTKTIIGGTFQMGNTSTAASQTFIVGSAIPFNNFTVNATNAPIVKLVTNNLTIDGTLTLNGGNIDGATNSKDVVVTNSATSAIVRTAGYINGNLTRALATTGVAYDYPVGLSATANYLPAALTFTNLTAGNLTVKATTGDETNIGTSYIDDTKSVNAFWALSGTAASTNYAGTLTYNSGLTDGGVTVADFKIGKYNSAWTYPTVTPTPSATSLSFSAASGLGNLAVGNCKTPTAVVTSSQTICQSGTATVSTATATNGAILWTHNGAGSITAGATTTTPTYTSVAGDAGNTVTLTMTVTGLCTAVTATYVITVNAASVGGTATATAATLCTGNSTTIALTANTGSTIQWQQSADGSTGWATVTGGSGDTTATYTTPTLTATTYYRAVVTNGVCSSANSSTASVTIDAASVGGTATATDATLCTGNSTTIALTVNTGSTIQWQQSADGSTGWATVTGGSGDTTATYTTPTLTATTYYRAVVTNGVCSSANSSTASVTISAASSAGTPTADETICSGKAAIVSVTGATGTIQWEQSANGSTGWASVTGGTGGTTATYTSGTLTATTYYRAVVTSGVCSAATSASIIITIKSTTWNGSAWSNGNPDATTGIIFDGAYTSSANIEACSCTLTSNAVVTIASGHTLSLLDAIDATSGAITFEDTSSLLQDNNVVNTGAITYKRKTSVLNNNYDFVYWGSPVAAQPLARMWMSVTSNATFYSYNGGVNWTAVNANSTMTPGLGYIARARNNGVGTDWNNVSQTFTLTNTWEARFHGVPNNGEISVPIKKVGASFDNLLSNPYPSAIDLELFWADTENAGKLTGNFSFWTHTSAILVNAYSGGDYSIYNANSDTQTATSNNGGTPDQYVDSGQGFFVEYASLVDTGTQTNTVKFKNSHRVSGNNNGFYRTALPNAQVIPTVESHNVWLNLTNSIGGFKQLIVQYAQGATYGYDLYLDAIASQGNPNIDFYSIIPNRKFTINSRVLPFQNTDTIDFGYHVGTAGTFQIAIDHVNGFFLTSENIYLEDKLLNITVDLRAAPYSFTTELGTFTTRFVLHYLPTSTLGTGSLNVENSVQVITNEKATVYSSNQNIKNIVVFDLLGRKIDSYKNVGLKQFTMNNLNKTMSGLFVKITLENDVVVTKKIVF